MLRSGLPVTEDRRVSEAVDVVVELRPWQHRPLVTRWGGREGGENGTQTGQSVKSPPPSAEIQLTRPLTETFNGS